MLMLKAGTEQSIISVSTHKNLSRFGGRFKFLGQDFLMINAVNSVLQFISK